MIVKSLKLINFTSHEKTVLALPPRGVAVVTGENGAGKSSFIEATAYGLWGQTLRGADPWRAGVDGRVDVEVAGLQVTRKRKGSRTSLVWSREDAEAVTYETNTKAQEALEAVVGEFDIWRKTHVFSSQDASNFTLATDGERKRLLESILGLEKFDAALALCRVDLAASERIRTEKVHAIEVHEAKLSGLQAVLVREQSELACVKDHGDVAAATAKVAELNVMVGDIDDEMKELRAQLREFDQRVASKQADVRHAKEQFSVLADGVCAACGQPIDAKHKAAIGTKLRAAADAAQDLSAALAHSRREVEDQLAELENERANLGKRCNDLKATLLLARAAATQKAALQERLDAAQGQVYLASEALARMHAAHDKATVESQLLAAVETTLGLRGVRAHVLGRALVGVEVVANSWLARIAGRGMRLALRPYTEKKSGGVSDAIALEVEGAGGGHGYKASSGGERRRIDIALLLALAEVAQAAHGTSGGTMWFDEVFDALDPPGVEAVAEALGELAASRTVVVVSHSDALAARLPAVKRVTVAGGRVS